MQAIACVIQRQDTRPGEPRGFIGEHMVTFTFQGREELQIEIVFKWLVLKYLFFLKKATSTEVKPSSCKVLLKDEKITD